MLINWLESVLIDPIDRVIDKTLRNGNANALLRVLVFVPLIAFVFMPLQLIEMLFDSVCRSLSTDRASASSVGCEVNSGPSELSSSEL
jgi:hypothetical protein